MTTQIRPSCFRRFSAFKTIILCLLAGATCMSFVGCGGDTESSTSPVDEITSSSSDGVVESSDGSALLLTSSSESESSSGEKAVDGSSSSDGKASSSSGKVESSSSGKGERSSSSEVAGGSSSSDVVAGSSSSEKSSSSEAESSSSVESSSSEEPSSSSVVESSSSVAESSSSLEIESSSSIALSSSSETPTVKSIYDAENNSLTDLRDNQVYKTVTIGEQIWMAENLNYMPEDTVGTIYSGGTVCGGGENNSREDSEKCDIFGRLYLRKVALNKTTASNRRGICPDGWSIPQQSDWKILMEFVVNDASKLKSVNAGWSNEATNESGFSAIPTGNYNNVTGYDGSSWATYFFYWHTGASAYFLRINDYDPDVYYSNNTLYFSSGADYMMYPVRCIKN